jgi:D-alanyl-D-alanine dipeptidase
MRPTTFLQSINLRLCGLILVLLQLGVAQEASFRITPQHPVEELRAEALKAQPPREQGTFLKPNLLELVKLDPTIKLDIRYATSNNFLGTPVYTQPRAFLQRPAAEALLRAHRELKAQGYGLIIHDGYRPWYVTKIFWDATPDDKRIFVADPAEGSRHNRGCAVDLSLYDLKTGEEVKMPSGYDEMTHRAFADYSGGTTDERARRALLRHAMEKQGFTVYPQEWWHFDYKDWKQYPILNVKFEDLGQ